MGASPWGNSPATSPRQPRPGLGALGEDPPSFRFNSPTANGFAQDPTSPEGFQRPGTATSASGTDGENEGSTTLSAPEDEGPAEPQSAASSQPPPPAATPASPGVGSQPVQGEPTSSQAQEPRRPTKPQHKLQAKVTGLERTGKKDPILRFDIHVSAHVLKLRPLVDPRLTDNRRRICHVSALPNIAMSDGCTPNLLSLQSISSQPTPKPWSPLFRPPSRLPALALTRTRIGSRRSCSAGSTMCAAARYS